MTQKLVSIRYNTVGGKEVKAQLTDIGREGSRAFDSLRNSSASSGPAIQNAAFQVGDFFTQVAGGTDPTRALAQQLPQLLGGMGVIGAVAGAAAAAFIPMIGNFLSADESAEDLEDALSGLETGIRDYRAAVDAVLTPMGEMFSEFGRNAEAAREVQGIILSLSRVKLSDKFARVGEGAQDELGDLIDLVREYQQIASEDLPVAGIAYEAAGAMSDIIEEIRDEWGMTYLEASRVVDAVGQMNDALASGEDQQLADATTALALAMGDALDNGMALTDEGRDLLDLVAQAAIEQQRFAADTSDAAASANTIATAGMPENVGAAADEAVRLATEMATAADAARLLAAQQALAAGSKTYSGRGGDPRTSNGQGYGEFDRPSLDEIIDEESKKLDRGSSGRRGGGGANREAMELEREAKRLIEETRTEAEKYSAEIERINELLEKNAISEEVHARALEMAKEKYTEAGDAAKELERINEDMKDAMLDFIIEGKNGFDDLAKSIARAALQAALFGDGPLGGMFGGGGILSSLFPDPASPPSFDGGGYTGNRPRTGGLDGKGGFMAMLHPQETILDHTKGQGGGPVSINVNVAGARGNAEIEDMVASGVRLGLAQYDRSLPRRVKQISGDPRRN